MNLLGKAALSCLTLCAASAAAQAEGSLPAPYSTVGGKVTLSEFRSLDYPETAEGIFLNALYYIMYNQERDEEGNLPQMEVDYDSHKFAVGLTATGSQTGAVYSCSFSLMVADNIITLVFTDISCQTSVSPLKLSKRLSFEKLQPEKKSNHKEYCDEFAQYANKCVETIMAYVSNATPPVVTHYAEIKSNRVVKGMTEAECTLALGQPMSKNVSGGRTQWIYGSYNHVFFEDGVVVAIIQ